MVENNTTIPADSIFSGAMNTVDSVIGNFVHDVYVNLVQANATVITLLFTLYVMMLGYQFISHHHHFQIAEVVKRIILMLSVYALVMNWQLYHLFFYKVFTSEPEHIAKVISAAGGHAGDISSSMDTITDHILTAARELWGQWGFSISGAMFLLYGLGIFIIGMLLIVYTLLLFIYAKMMMAVMLALGPIFILFIMWDQTKGLFSAWLNMLISIALIPVITSTVLMLMLSVINVTLAQLNLPVEQMQLVGVAPFLVLCMTTILILSQVLQVSSGLGGGIVLSSLSNAGRMLKSAWNGMSKAAGMVKNLGGRTTSTMRNSENRRLS